jgi:hypothetical protein
VQIKLGFCFRFDFLIANIVDLAIILEMSKTSSPSSPNAGLPALNKEIQTHLASRQISSFKLCSQLEIPHAQFAEAIKRTNVFPRDPRLFDILTDLSIQHDGFTDESSYDKLQTRYTVNFKRRYASKGRENFDNLADQLKSNQELPQTVYQSIKDFSAEVAHYFSLFDKDTIFVFTSLNLLPFEMTPGDGVISCAKHIAKAAVNGAYFLYLFPKEKLQKKYQVEGAIKSCAFEQLFQDVFLQTLKEQVSSPSDIEKIERHVLMLAIDDSPFFAVDHKFALYKVRRKLSQEVETYCLGLSPFGKQDNAYILPLNQEFMRKLSTFVTVRLQKATLGQDNIASPAFYTPLLEAFRKN